MMVQITVREWQIAGAAAGIALAAGAALWWMNRQRPTPDELERERRETLVNFGRIVDGMLLDGFDVVVPEEEITGTSRKSRSGKSGITPEPGLTRHMLLYQYEISGVTYECSQDVTSLVETIDPAMVKLGFPCSIRYQPGSPENSILIAERWSGLREAVPVAAWPGMEEHLLDPIHPHQLMDSVQSGYTLPPE